MQLKLYLIEILHQTTTWRASVLSSPSCILLKFYIKPQLRSNYNYNAYGCILLKFYIKPQLARQWLMVPCGCILLKFYIKPQQPKQSQHRAAGCILLKFYIKPQQRPDCLICFEVVSYWNSTSNHNDISYMRDFELLYLIEILHQTTTVDNSLHPLVRCILLKFYIKPQLHSDSFEYASGCILLKFYIKPQLGPHIDW